MFARHAKRSFDPIQMHIKQEGAGLDKVVPDPDRGARSSGAGITVGRDDDYITTAMREAVAFASEVPLASFHLTPGAAISTPPFL